MNKCFTPCIYYHEIRDQEDKNKILKINCDMKDIDIRKIPQDEINNCENYKTYKDVLQNNHLTDYKYNSKIYHKERDKI